MEDVIISEDGVVTYLVNRRKMLFPLVISLLFVIAGIFVFKHEPGWKAGFSLAFFSICLLVCGVTLLPGITLLRLDPDGFTSKTLAGTKLVRWGEVESFGVVIYKQYGWVSNKFVGYRFTAESARQSKISRAFGGHDAIIPNFYAVQPEQLATALNAYLVSQKRRSLA